MFQEKVEVEESWQMSRRVHDLPQENYVASPFMFSVFWLLVFFIGIYRNSLIIFILFFFKKLDRAQTRDYIF